MLVRHHHQFSAESFNLLWCIYMIEILFTYDMEIFLGIEGNTFMLTRGKIEDAKYGAIQVNIYYPVINMA